MDTLELDSSETAELKARSERPEGAQEGTFGVSHCLCLFGAPESVSLKWSVQTHDPSQSAQERKSLTGQRAVPPAQASVSPLPHPPQVSPTRGLLEGLWD